MSKTLILINLLLILIVSFLAAKGYEEWTNVKPTDMEGIAPKQKTVVSPASFPTVGQSEISTAASFKSISEKNVFSPDRKEFPISATADGRRAQMRPNVTLYGLVVGEEFRSAVISNPARRPEKGERETMTVTVGDRVGDYKVATILGDRVTLESEGDSFDVLLYDPARPKKRPAVVPPSPPSRPSTPAPTAPRPVSPSPGITQPSPSPVPPGIGQATLPPPPGQTVPRRNLLRQVPTPRARPTPPARVPAIPDEGDEEEEDTIDEE